MLSLISLSSLIKSFGVLSYDKPYAYISIFFSSPSIKRAFLLLTPYYLMSPRLRYISSPAMIFLIYASIPHFLRLSYPPLHFVFFFFF